jgi:hypothetical protein
LSNNADTNNKQQQYTSNNTYGSNTGKTNNSNKPNFTNSKGTVNNNTPLNPDVKVEKQENLSDVKNKMAGIFQKSNAENQNIKPTKNYLDGANDVKYKEEIDVNIEKRVFQSNKNETNFVDIDKNQDVRYNINIIFMFFLNLNK